MKNRLTRVLLWLSAAIGFLLSMAPKRWGNHGP